MLLSDVWAHHGLDWKWLTTSTVACETTAGALSEVIVWRLLTFWRTYRGRLQKESFSLLQTYLVLLEAVLDKFANAQASPANRVRMVASQPFQVKPNFSTLKSALMEMSTWAAGRGG